MIVNPCTDGQAYPVIPLMTSMKLVFGAAKGIAHIHDRGIYHKVPPAFCCFRAAVTSFSFFEPYRIARASTSIMNQLLPYTDI